MADQPPPFRPPAGAVAHVSIIDTTTSINNLGTHHLMKPPMPGMEVMPEIPAWSFLIESSDGRRALYDLGVPPDWADSFAPVTVKRLRDNGWDVRAQRHVVDILKDGGVDPANVQSIVWSHWHWDHIGDPGTFPSSTEVVVGPGFQQAFRPYYPEKENSPIKASYFSDRQLREIDFSSSSTIQIGPFRAHDFFADGSFYLLDTPGHAVGHLGGLVRTTSSPSTFILLGGDLCHHAGEVRPSPFLPLPQSLTLPGLSTATFGGGVCPGAELQELQTRRGREGDRPFFEPAMGEDVEEAKRTIEKTWVADRSEDVLFVFAHDATMKGVVDFFPKRANAWKEKGWRDQVLWRFVEDFEKALRER